MLTLKPLAADGAELAAIYADPWVAKVGHDDRAAAPVIHPLTLYLGAYVYGALVGAFLLIRFSRREIEIHSLLQREALPWCRKLGRLCIGAAFADPDVTRVTANIIEGLESARNYCLKLGFVAEGFRRDAVMLGGRLVGVYVLGLIRQDWEATQ